MSKLTFNFTENEITDISVINEDCNFHSLSHNRYLSLDWLLKFPNANWDYQALTHRYNFNKKWYLAFPDKPWDFSKMSSCSQLTLTDIINMPKAETLLDFGKLSSNPNLNILWLQQFPEAEWDIGQLSVHPKFSLHWLEVISTDTWNFRTISQHKKFPLCLLEEYPNKDWDFQAISYHESLNCYWFVVFKDKDWDFEHLQKTYFHTRIASTEDQQHLDMWVLNFPQDKLDFKELSKHPYLTLQWLQKFPTADWDFPEISKRHIGWHSNYHLTPERIDKNWLRAFPDADWNPQALRKLEYFKLDWCLECPHLAWEFDKMSFDSQDVSLKFLKQFPNQNLNSRWLWLNSHIDIRWLDYIKLTPENIKLLSRNSKVSIDWINKFPDAEWDWAHISEAKDVNANWIREFPTKPWNFEVLSKKINLDLLVLNLLPNAPWIYSSLSYNKGLKLKDLIQNKRQNWDFNVLSAHPNCTLEWIKAFPDKIDKWCFSNLSRNKFLNLTWLEAYPDATWDYTELSKHKNFRLEWFKQQPSKPWVFSYIAHKKGMKSLIVLQQFYHPHLNILQFYYSNINMEQKRLRNQVVSVILLQPQNYYWLEEEYQGKDIFMQALAAELSDEEKENVLEADQQNIITYQIHPNLFFNPTTDLELTDLSGDTYWIAGWFQSDNIMNLIHETLPDLGEIDIFVESFTDKPDQIGSHTYNSHLKYLLFNNPSGPQAMIVYPEENTEN